MWRFFLFWTASAYLSAFIQSEGLLHKYWLIVLIGVNSRRMERPIALLLTTPTCFDPSRWKSWFLLQGRANFSRRYYLQRSLAGHIIPNIKIGVEGLKTTKLRTLGTKISHSELSLLTPRSMRATRLRLTCFWEWKLRHPSVPGWICPSWN